MIETGCRETNELSRKTFNSCTYKDKSAQLGAGAARLNTKIKRGPEITDLESAYTGFTRGSNCEIRNSQIPTSAPNLADG